MTEIKCRYSTIGCIITNEAAYYELCDGGSGCEDYKRPKDARPIVFNPPCANLTIKKGEFATTVKRYSWEDDTLIVGKRVLDKNDIDYLEIDGRVLIGKEANNVHD